MQEPTNHPPAIAPATLSYETGGTGKRYQRLLIEPNAPIYFPDTCCDCLKPTTIQYTITGNRLRASGALLGGLVGGVGGALIGGALGENNHFELKAPVCNRCWRAYQRRRKSWFWLGPLIGACAMLTPLAPLYIAIARQGDWRSLLCMGISFSVIGCIAGFFLNRRLANAFAGPPMKIYLHRWSGRVTLRFRNAAYIGLFRRAQTEVPEQEAARLRQIDAPAPLQWYYLENGQPVGPVLFGDIRLRVAEGTLQPDDQIWAEDQTEWVTARSVPGLFAAEDAGG